MSDESRKTTAPQAYERLARHYSDRFWSALSSTHTTLTLWAASLLLVYIGIISPLPDKVSKAESVENGIEERNKELQSIDPRSPEAIELRQKQEKAEEKKEQLENDLARVKTPIGDLEIRQEYVPFAWALLFAGLLTFFLYRRALLLTLLGQTIRIQTIELGDKLENLKGLGAWAPFWLAPLPEAAKASKISREDVKSVLGWGNAGYGRAILTISSFLAALLLYGCVVRIGWEVARESGFKARQIQAFVGLVLVSFYLLAILIVFFQRRLCYGDFPEKMMEVSRSRRIFLTSSFMILAGVSLASRIAWKPLLAQFVPTDLLRRPRYRTSLRSRLTPLADHLRNTFQHNKNSQVAHYVDQDGWAPGAEQLQPRNLEPVERESAGRLIQKMAGEGRLDESQVGFVAERLALEKARDNDLTSAIVLVWGGILKDAKLKKATGARPSYRLYDLLAGLAKRANQRPHFVALEDYVRQTWPDDPVLKSRREKWNGQAQSAWSKRWTAPGIVWKEAKRDTLAKSPG